ncbi:regulatory LacI family protein [Mobilisporobacter senegalensis]|uniref:Regulatory LacI family protein n=1 Tax=Mobilisporobacter senegalensis TaxID=1329262 RepID=A0A3N1XEM8_9FIRM|nr:LacI family DNA-binding transcriptional regulator [Mobilisporobacter senegalensis]ROR23422.1 regulatory LacI family protein [Mobilisporobacter senegalensis]
MRKEKVTMKDIAKEVNVSLATVSYVLNHSEKEKISHDTRIKVLETAKRMGYTPNQAARSLANKKSNLIGIIVNLSRTASSSMKYQSLDLASELQAQIYNAGYDTILSITQELEDIQIKYKHSLEAVFIIDINEKALKKITNHYYVPLIFLDCDFEDGLFYKILPDYSLMIEKAKQMLGEEHPFLVMESIINNRMKEQIFADFEKDDIFVSKRNTSLKDFLAKKTSRKGIVIGDTLASQVERYIDNKQIVILSSDDASDLLLEDTRRIVVSNKRKAEVAINILEKLTNLSYDENGNTRIFLCPEE